jgi:hypothetical protein
MVKVAPVVDVPMVMVAQVMVAAVVKGVRVVDVRAAATFLRECSRTAIRTKMAS